METQDIILEEIPPLLPQIACNAESLLPCFVSHSGDLLHQAQLQAQAAIFLPRNSFLWLQTRLISEGTIGYNNGEGTAPG